MKNQYSVFVIDDDPIYLKMIENLFETQPRLKIHGFDSGEKALDALHNNPDILIVDYYLNLNDERAANGMDILKKIKEKLPNIEVLVLSGQLLPSVTFDFIFHENVRSYMVKEKSAFANLQREMDSLVAELDKRK